MKFLRRFHDPDLAAATLYQLRSKGIATQTTPGAPRGTYQLDVYVVLDDQFSDAVEVLNDPSHEVQAPVDVDEVERLMNNERILNPIVRWALVFLLSAIALAAGAGYLVTHVSKPASNNSSERPF